MTLNFDKCETTPMMRCFLEPLFKPDESIEIRLIEVGSDEPVKGRSRVQRRNWRGFTCPELMANRDLGLTDHQIWYAVFSRSKLATDAWQYFQRTWRNVNVQKTSTDEVQ